MLISHSIKNTIRSPSTICVMSVQGQCDGERDSGDRETRCDEVTNESTPLSTPHSTEMLYSSAMARRPQFQSTDVSLERAVFSASALSAFVVFARQWRWAREAHFIKDLLCHLN